MSGDCCCAVPACFGLCAGRRCADPSVAGGLVEASRLADKVTLSVSLMIAV